MVTYLANRVSAFGWIPAHALHDPASGLGVLLRQSRGHYTCAPEVVDGALLGAAQRLNVGVLVTMQLGMLQPILAGLPEGQAELVMKGGYQLQVVASLAAVTAGACGVRKFQYAAVVRREGLLLVWQDDVAQILPHAQRMEDRLLSYVWGRSARLSSPPGMSPFTGQTPLQSPTPSVSSYSMHLDKGGGAVMVSTDEASDGGEGGGEGGPDMPESIHRPVVLHSAVFIGLGVCLAIVLVYGFSVGQLVSEALLDGSYARLALVAACPLLICAGMFFFQVIFGDLWQMVGPLGGLQTNSRTYSCLKPNMRQAYALGFSPPHMTIQMPVYKEGMDSVIIPTVRSLQAAISFYESRGGTASIFVNDDGMRLLPDQEAQVRKDFYQDNDIGWIARPKHGDDGYLRKGKFKKASNMNFALNISQKVEAYMQDVVDAKYAEKPGFKDGDPLMLEEQELHGIYEQCLQRVLAEEPKARAGGNIRIGEFILIVDSDTRVVSPTWPLSVCFRILTYLSPYIHSPSTVSSTARPRCSSPPRWPSSSTRPASCRSSRTTSRTASPSSPTWSTPPSASLSARARWPPLSATTPSSAGRPSRTSASLRRRRRAASSPTGPRATSRRTLTLRCACRSRAARSGLRATTATASRRAYR